MFGSLSLQTKFLIAPFIGVLLTLILYVTSNQVIRTNAELFQNLSETNLVQISEISEITLLITASNSEIITLLLESDKLDEEGIYVEGKKRLNQIYLIEERLNKSIHEKDELIIEGKNIFHQVQVAFTAYKGQIISSIEMSSVDVKQASYELVLANDKLKVVNKLFLKLSKYYTNELSRQAILVEDNIYKKTYITELTIGLLILMIWSAFYFSKNTSNRLNQVYQALIKLSTGSTDIVIYRNKDTYIQDIWNAVSEFKESIEKSEIYKNDLLMQKFAFDQHAIIATTDIKGIITSANAKFCEVSGYSAKELIGRNHRIINSGNHSKAFWHDMYKTVSKGNVWHSEILNRAKDGHLYWVDTSIIPITSTDNKITGYISIRTDITEKKKQFQKLIETNVVAKSAVVAKSQFLAAMSHEIRTPMNGVIGMLELMLDDKLDTQQKKRVQIALSSSKSLLNLINDILDLSKIEAGKLEIESIDFDLKKMLEEFTQFMRFQAEEKNLTLSLNCSEMNESMVVGDSSRLRQILTNIAGNAIKFTQQGEINIHGELISHSDKRWQFKLSISDTGIGIPADKMASLFDVFSQVDISNTRKYGGTGLGLAISQRLAKLMHGEIIVRSEEGKGSCFTCVIELDKSTKALEITPIDQMISSPQTIPLWPENTRLLLVEDNRINQLVALGLLKRFGLKAEVAINGLEALSILKEAHEPFDIILMDCQMPEMDGYETTRCIRENKQDVPIIAMTANAMKGDREKCLQAGMNDYLTKPIDPDILLEKLTFWLLS
ncbi:PAS domain-containing hybrid sensor histidine kinase/response regulator [Colwellia hornerae]|uniref:Sensory/regulatory protein RpfC n=1 Tax=Colwellia hornerae TaxID=89402 RepID=A0A5C6QE90_9GAMM|nr:response regulator [Colwellia hornerae]TWX59377.1 response regulator [Colwellia hornerae]TWX62747.1 response regulator [Colwellia hornerae]TWX67061.1 response regulator [Colwellia hornerae]